MLPHFTLGKIVDDPSEHDGSKFMRLNKISHSGSYYEDAL